MKKYAYDYSIVVPIYNDGYLARGFCEELQKVFTDFLGKESFNNSLEIIFINDGSQNDSLEILVSLTSEFDFVKVIDLSRNFGQHCALACGFNMAQGEVVIRMNVDMQDPPSELPNLIKVARDGDYDLVVGEYEERNSPVLDKATSYLYFLVFRYLTGMNISHNTSPMRVMSRNFIDAYNLLTEKSRFPQGLDMWLGFKHAFVKVPHFDRSDKKSSYTFKKRLKMAFEGVLYFSDKPIKILAAIGFVLASLGIALGMSIVAGKLMGIEFMPGYVSLAAIGLIGFGLQVMATGAIGLYVGAVFREVQNRPVYLVRKIYSKMDGV